MAGVGTRVWVGGSATACALAILVACGSYGEEPSRPEDAATAPTQDGTAEGGGPDGDAADAAAEAGPRGVCPAAKFPGTGAANERPQRVLYVPNPDAGQAYPFAITTDSDFVYWIEQRASVEASNPYDGVGVGRVLRVTRAGSSSHETAFELASNERYATALALDGDYVYWTTAGPNTLRRVRRDCKNAPCSAESVVPLPQRISRLAATRDGRGLLYAQGENSVFRIEVGGNPSIVGVPGTFPAMALTGTHFYWTAGGNPQVGRAETTGLSMVPEFARLGGDAGLSVMATDCTRLWGIHGLTNVLTRIELDGGVSATSFVGSSVFEVIADERYVYVGSADTRDLHAYDKQSGQSAVLASGSFWRLATDDVGTYWGEHTRMGANAGTLVMLVK